jgi:hypothetical protein
MIAMMRSCPFCGGSGTPSIHSDDCYFTARQKVREAAPADLSMVPDLIAAWNRRTPSSSHPAEGERQSIDSPAFKSLLGAYVGALEAQETRRHVENVRTALIAHINTWAGRSAGDAARDALRYRVLRQHVAPRDVSISMTVPWQDIPPNQTISERIDMLCDSIIERDAAPSAHLVEQVGEQSQADASLSRVRDAIADYYRALNRREHGHLAMDRSFRAIERETGMSWDIWTRAELTAEAQQGQDSAKESAEGSDRE